MQARITKAGPYNVEWIKCPQYAGAALLDLPRTGVLHTTEGEFAGALGIFRQHFAPHFLISSWMIAQLTEIGLAGESLRTHNNMAIVQIEMVGFSKEQLWYPDDETAKRVAAVMATMHTMFGVPLSHPWADGDYGRAGPNPHRKSGKWGEVAGWYGHADVPSPDTHWDPGNLQWSKLLALASTFVGGAT